MKLMITAAFLLAATLANAQDSDFSNTTKPVICGKFSAVLSVIMGDNFREVPIWMGDDARDGSRYSLFVNDKTKSWSFVQYKDNNACVLGIGSGAASIALPATI